MEDFFWRKIKSIERASYDNLSFEITPATKRNTVAVKANQTHPKGGSKLETLGFYMQGMKIEQIAAQRGMAISTIEGHLAEFVFNGEVNIFDFLDTSLLEKIKSVAEKTGYDKLSSIKNELGEEATYGQIKMAVNYLKKIPQE